jgi:hypothetical protein
MEIIGKMYHNAYIRIIIRLETEKLRINCVFCYFKNLKQVEVTNFNKKTNELAGSENIFCKIRLSLYAF